MSLSRSITSNEANDSDCEELKEQYFKDMKKIREETLAPSELREIFSRFKCCKKNCMVNKLRMPLVSSNAQICPESEPPISGLYCSIQNSKTQNIGPASIEQFEHMVWQARDVIKTFKVSYKIIFYLFIVLFEFFYNRLRQIRNLIDKRKL